MDMIDDAATRPPSVILVNGREYMLYDEFLGRIKMAEVKLLWFYSSLLWVGALTFALLLPFTEAWWPIFIAIALLLVMCAGVFFMFSRPVMTTPVTVVETHRNGTSSRLSVSTRRHGTLTVTAHADMADFLLRAITADRRRRFSPRRDVPADLVHPKMMRHVWSGTAASVAMLAILAARVALGPG
ncbi:hypothetical protein [Demequina lutea]|uniref:Uncharacterized protein n=1 Tax=Demequina lutea TaxID=431489 RepID=A0A7Y9ZAW9_9MICO|nr:hypothetical protein [Demequina lutea]NYI41826.1 hypothetical protein [Demequina lutea]